MKGYGGKIWAAFFRQNLHRSAIFERLFELLFELLFGVIFGSLF